MAGLHQDIAGCLKILPLMTFVLECLMTGGFAYDICLETNGNRTDCKDTYSSVGFCCNCVGRICYNCCHYTQVWALWYFWVAIVVFLIIVSALVGACHRMHNNSRRTSRAVRQAPRNPELGMDNLAASDLQQQDSFQTKLENAPPSYDQVEAQGITSQFAEYSMFGSTNNNSSSCPGEQPQVTPTTNSTAMTSP